MRKREESHGTGLALFLLERRHMTPPRRIVQGASYLLTRRCSERRFFLRPSKPLNQTFLYLLAVAARRYGLRLHTFCVLSNHFHAVLTDPHGRLPAFEQFLDSLVARSVNSLLGRWESFWAPGSYSAVALSSPADLLRKAAYVLANPAAAGLVRRGSQWPGLWSSPDRVGAGPVTVARPKEFFREKGPLPETAELELVCPEGFASAEAFRGQLAEAVRELEDEAARALGARGRKFLGVERVLAQRAGARPAPVEPRRGLEPRVAGEDKWKRVEALARLKAFLLEYRAAWRSFAQGLRGAEFPHGTYGLRVAYGVRCAPA